ncbi:Maf1 regulator [Babesia microti strain RI]|uniref:Maf1 regulator n=1 Tax=Babesia microti (strain RI) TaxID=1133968 RepID=I7I8Z2_BABMR|nr:Maf1 regulator [Babesia microti strain RI]CCF73933.1 Maf1 regulator [Babesia microti strain RI]|eukprot:XP_012648542.1 Maf1 regulator [Babesia microti strain RI]
MIFVEDTNLARLRSILNDFDASDRYIDVRLELLHISNVENSIPTGFSVDNYTSVNNSTVEAVEGIYCYLIMAMNKCFPDYDFSSLNYSNFKRIKSIGTVLNTIDYKLSYIMERLILDFSNDLWSSIKKVISLNESEVYTYESGPEEDLFNSECCLNSFNYFFYDKSQCRILFFSSVTKSKCLNRRKDSENDLFISELTSAVRAQDAYVDDSSCE